MAAPTDPAAASIAERLQRSAIGPLIRRAVSRATVPLWVRRGRPAPAPPHRKQAIVSELVRRHRPDVFVETGTYRGDTLATVAPHVRRAISIELDPTLADQARRRFRQQTNVEIVTGDSAEQLVSVVDRLTADGTTAVFWLDGHFSGGATAGAGLCPILAEVDTVLGSGLDHVVLIDDIRLFDGTDGYPTFAELRDRIAGHRPDWVFEVVDDIGRVHAPAAR